MPPGKVGTLTDPQWAAKYLEIGGASEWTSPCDWERTASELPGISTLAAGTGGTALRNLFAKEEDNK